MNTSNEIEVIPSPEDSRSGSSRRSFLKGAALTGATTLAALGGLATAASAQQHDEDDSMKSEHDHLKKGDRDILVAAEIAEALAVTTYSNIIDIAPFFQALASDDQGYLIAARQEEMSHYLLEQSVTDQFTPFTQFFYPPKMFADAQTTLNILVTLEDAFIAAYLVGVRNFSTRNLRLTAARIMGIESDHRTLARVLAPNVTAAFGGPIETITGIQGVAESVDPPNNNGYERTLCWTSIDQALAALTPFVDFNAAKAAGFDTSQAFPFQPFNPTLPNPLGDFVSFSGC
jgi:Ferritin-like domain